MLDFGEKREIAPQFNAIRIGLASPEKIVEWASGEVTKPETINYRTFKPERNGLFCAKIFGPVKDWECICGKYKRMKHRGIVCERCGVEVIQSKVRRERMGYIKLASPVSHIWFFRGLPSRIGQLLNISLRDLEKVLYFEEYIVLDPGDAGLTVSELVDEVRYDELLREHGDTFRVGMGAEAIKELLQRIDIPALCVELREAMKTEKSKQKLKKTIKRLHVAELFRDSGNKPEWMILDVVPIIPPELRPLVPLDGGRFATSDLNDLYRRVINRNNRLKRLEDLNAPEIIIRNEKRMLQEAVDSLFDNGRRGNASRGPNNRPLRSLSDMLKGKQGRFRQNLLGKRVDYSGRSVIVIGPELKLNQCGLPKKMAIELFKPFIFNKLEERGHVPTIKAAKKAVENEAPEVWDILEEVVKEHPILLNRAPTLHRLGIQAFLPVLIEGKAIRIHPLVCAAFNADFDGDQMAVHIPLSLEAQLECKVLMLASNNIISPSNGRPITVPSQDIVLGCFYLTKERPGEKGEGRLFSNPEEVIVAHDAGEVGLQASITVRISKYHCDCEKTRGVTRLNVVCPQCETPCIFQKRERIKTTVGRIIFNSILPDGFPFFNKDADKKALEDLVAYSHLWFGNGETVALLDKLKDLGFAMATNAGISICIDDMIIPPDKEEMIRKAEEKIQVVEKKRHEGAITDGERYNMVIDVWSNLSRDVADAMFSVIQSGLGSEEEKEARKEGWFNPINMMSASGARGAKQQIRQLAGMRGLMAKPSGEIIETPITRNFREGLNVIQYFISTHGARKGLADTALKTADSGYLTRRLVDVAQDVIITEYDCGTFRGINVESIIEGGMIIEPLRDRILGCIAAERDIRDPHTGEILARANEEITEEMAQAVADAGITRVKIRSVLTCETRYGACAMCYGRNLASGKKVDIGEAVGVIAAQSIGEPGTQLTMRTFHIGGAASRDIEQSKHEAKNKGVVRYDDIKTVTTPDGSYVVINRNSHLSIIDEDGRQRERYPIVYGATMTVKNGEKVEPGRKVVEWDPYTMVILTEKAGKIRYHDVVEGVTMREETDEFGRATKVITEYSDTNLQPRITIRSERGREVARYLLPKGAFLVCQEGDLLYPGSILAKIPRETSKTKDITGGLPRVVELFEARKPRDHAIITEIDGSVSFKEDDKGKTYRVVIVTGENEVREYKVPKGAYINLQEGDIVRTGQPLMDGPLNPHDILDVKGPEELQKYLVNEIQQVYRLQGVDINDKHIEVIVRQMLRQLQVEEPGDTKFLPELRIDKWSFEEENQRVVGRGGKPATAKPILQGITKASLSNESFISGASFQETTRVLTEASIAGKTDYLRGLKENVVVGRLIPAGTGMPLYHDSNLSSDKDVEKELEERRRPKAVDVDQIAATAAPATPAAPADSSIDEEIEEFIDEEKSVVSAVGQSGKDEVSEDDDTDFLEEDEPDEDEYLVEYEEAALPPETT